MLCNFMRTGHTYYMPSHEEKNWPYFESPLCNIRELLFVLQCGIEGFKNENLTARACSQVPLEPSEEREALNNSLQFKTVQQKKRFCLLLCITYCAALPIIIMMMSRKRFSGPICLNTTHVTHPS